MHTHFILVGKMLEILENKKVLNLIERIQIAEGRAQDAEVIQEGKKRTRRSFYYPQGSVLVSGYNPAGASVFLSYASREEFDETFVKQDKQQLNGCSVARIHSGVEYMVFMELQTPGNPEEWIIKGRDEWKNPIEKRFSNKEEFLKGRAEVYKKIEGLAIAHHVGTKVYHLVEVEKFRTQ